MSCIKCSYFSLSVSQMRRSVARQSTSTRLSAVSALRPKRLVASLLCEPRD
jgi:hypothetical protein